MSVKRIVVKIGSQVLCNQQGLLNQELLAGLVDQVATLRKEGWQVLIVSSGAVAAGKGALESANIRSNDPVTQRQVLAASGQVRLMQTYHSCFENHGINIAQVLASKSDFQTRSHYLNMRNCLEGILDAGIVPIVNENDVVSITELMFTDNDELAGLLAGMVNAQLLCMLSSVDGVFDGDQLVREWNNEVHKIEALVSGGTSQFGRGGMHSKLSVARKTSALGTEVVIANGQTDEVLLKVTSNKDVGTRFPKGIGTSPAKRWLASSDGYAVGAVHINEGAEQAVLDKGRLTSLLMVGAVKLDGDFSRGDVIRITGASGSVLGVGRSEYDSGDARPLLGQKDHKPLIHYDYLYLNE